MKLAVIKRVPGDGSCFYHAVLAGNETVKIRVTNLRKKIANVYAKINQNRSTPLASKYGSLLQYYAREQNMTTKKYIEQTQKCMWAGPLEVEILSRILNKRIAVYDKKDLKRRKLYDCVYNMDGIKPLLDFGDKRRKPIMIVIGGYQPSAQQFGKHYDSLLPLKLM